MIVASSCDNVELLLSGKVDELNCITGYTDCEVCVLFLLGVLHSVDELLLTEYVYVEVVCTLIKVTVKYVNQVGYALFLVVTECVGVDGLGVRNTIECPLVRKLSNRVEGSKQTVLLCTVASMQKRNCGDSVVATVLR